MRSPAETTLAQANLKLEGSQRNQELNARRAELTSGINEALQAVPSRESLTISQYNAADDNSLDLDISHTVAFNTSGNHRETNGLVIKGKLTKANHGSTVFPMYRVTRIDPTTDGGWLAPHYAIEVADPESETGYVPLALVEQSTPTSMTPEVQGSIRVSSDMFNSHDALSEAEMTELKATGLYVNPHGQAMLEEVQHILGMVAEQQQPAVAA